MGVGVSRDSEKGMKDLTKTLMFKAINLSPALFAKNSALILGYHSVPDRDQFEMQMKALQLLEHRVVSLTSIIDWMEKGSSPILPAVALTFDDCYLDQYRTAVPVLRRYGYPATFFAVSQRLGKTSEWAKESRGEPELPLMGEAELIQLNVWGFDVGCHTRTHPHLSGIDRSTQSEEIFLAKKDLENLLEVPVTLFCYPYGDYRPETLELVRQAGFKAAVSTVVGRVEIADDPFLLKRMIVLGQPVFDEFVAYLTGTIISYWELRRALNL